MLMKVEEVNRFIKTFVSRNKLKLDYLGGRQTQLLELSVSVGVVQHYKAIGYTISIINPGKKDVFRVKLGTRGHPSDYSRVLCSKGLGGVEIHSNISVRGAHDEGIYCVDVGIMKPGSVPDNKKKKWIAADNSSLLSFVEAKKLVIYPMLLAQFLGIVHEIKPKFIFKAPVRGYGTGKHLPPTLVTLGNYSGNSKIITKGFKERKIQLNIAENYDIRIATVRKNGIVSPFDIWK